MSEENIRRRLEIRRDTIKIAAELAEELEIEGVTWQHIAGPDFFVPVYNFVNENGSISQQNIAATGGSANLNLKNAN